MTHQDEFSENFNEASDDFHTKREFIAQGGCASFKFSMNWSDQGWGNQKGSMRWALFRDGNEICTVDEWGVAPHEATGVEHELCDTVFGQAIMAGDSVQAQFLVGGGGGHELKIHQFAFSYTHAEENENVHGKKEFKQTDHTQHDEADDDFHEHCRLDFNDLEGSKGHSKKAVLKFTWRDQGWGNQKGTIRVHIEGTEWSWEHGPAPHADEEHKVLLNDHGFKSHWHGQPVIVSYRVGGGGGHQLNFEFVKVLVKYHH